jgi:recombination protein RecA
VTLRLFYFDTLLPASKVAFVTKTTGQLARNKMILAPKLGKPVYKTCHRGKNHLHYRKIKGYGNVTPKREFTKPGRRQQEPKSIRFDTGAALSTGFRELDQALGLGGYPRGQICEIYGPPACGKTSLLLRAIAAAQISGCACAFIDGDHALDANQATRNGVNAQRVYLSEPASIEQALDITLTLAQSGAIDLIAIDTLSALPMQAGLQTKISTESGKAEYQKFERYVSQAIWRLSKQCQKSGTTVLICNQLRRQPDSYYHQGASTTATLALKMHAAVRLAMEPLTLSRAASDADRPETPDGDLRSAPGARIQIIKNKFAPITGHINLIIMYNHK